MFETRIHGRGGQGVVTAAELLSIAAFFEGRHAQAFPSFGSERTGAPVVSFCRVDNERIRAREPISAPDAVIIIDPTLLHQVDVFAGLRPYGYVVINGIGGVVSENVHRALQGLGIPVHTAIAGLGGRPITKDSLRRLFKAAGELPGTTFVDLDHALVDAELQRMLAAVSSAVAEERSVGRDADDEACRHGHS